MLHGVEKFVGQALDACGQLFDSPAKTLKPNYS